MTRLAILADIHGNLPALEAVINDMEQFKVDEVIVAGDLINGAPFSTQVLEIVFKNRWCAIRGNHEFYALNYGSDREKPVHKKSPMPKWLCERVVSWMSKIAAMPDSLTLYYPHLPPVRVEHGIPNRNNKAINPLTSEDTIHEWLAPVQESVFIAGHYHIAFERHVGQWHILNPGPVGMSCNGIRKAYYLILDGKDGQWQANFRHVDYDFSPIADAFHHSDDFADLGILADLQFEQLRMARPIINAFYDWHHETFPAEIATQEKITEFLNDKTAMWHYFGAKYQVNQELLNPS